MDQKTNTAWVIAGVLAVVVIVLAGMMWAGAKNQSADLDNVLSEGYEDLAMIRAELQVACEGPEADAEECDAKLEELSDLLEDFSDNIDVATTSAATTTPE